MIYNYSPLIYPNAYKQKKDTYSQKNMYRTHMFPNLTPKTHTSNYNFQTYPHKTFIHNEVSSPSSSKPSTCVNTSSKSENSLFEFFGIKLYFDDILLICLIFFLYNEGVKDEYLFIVLVLLLLS